MIIAVDFDGTCVTHEFPEVGKDIGAVPVLKELVKKGHKIILYTMRSHPDENNQARTLSGGIISNDILQDAIDWFKENEIPLWGINENPKQKEWTSSPKVYANIYIDDAALGTPLIYAKEGELYRPYVDWNRMRTLLKIKGVL
jgi:hypothetical protein